MGNHQSTPVQYARFIKGTEKPGYSAHLVNVLNTDGSTLVGAPKDFSTILDVFHNTAKSKPHKNFLGWRDQTRKGQPYIWKTWSQCQDYVNNLARGIKALEMMEDIPVDGTAWKFMGIYGKNRPEWVLTQLACMTLGGTVVAFYDTLGPAAIEFIIKQTQLTTITCTASQLNQLILLKTQGKADSIKFVISMDDYDISVEKDGKEAGITIMNIDEVITHGKKHKKIELDEFKPKADDVFMFCYTSGTTGDPKAAMLTHKNVLTTTTSNMQVEGIQFTEDDSVISYLPLAHIFEQTIFISAMQVGFKIGYYSGDPLKLLDDLKALKPTLFASVPRLFNRIYDKIQAGIKEKSAIEQALVQKAVDSKLYYLKNGCFYTHYFWDSLVFHKFQALLGGKVRLMVTGSAPINTDVLSFLKVCFCAPIHEGYAQTESVGAGCLTMQSDPEAGHVGGPPTCMRIRLRDIPEMQYLSTDPNPRGEICFQGVSVFKGYFKNPEKTKEAISEDGWLASGDVGEVFPNGSVRIIDRAKNIFKLAQGEYIAPEKLENIYVQSPYVAQIFVHGESTEAWLMAVVVIEKPEVQKLAQAKGWLTEEGKVETILDKPELHQAIIENFNELAKSNKLSGLEKIKKLHLIDEPFSIENDLITPTFKIKRNVARNAFKDQIAKIYSK